MFVDETGEAGIDFKHTNGRTEKKHVIETMGSGAVFFDYDDDGDMDLYVVNSGYVPGTTDQPSPGNVLYQNNGDGTFTDVTTEAGVGDRAYGMAAAAADYDNDGDQDLYVANYRADVLYRNNGDGTFTDVTTEAGIDNELWGVAVAYLDFDRDGHLDIFVANYLVYDVTMPAYTYRGVVGYGHPRLYEGTPDVLYRNNGDGTFTNVAAQAGLVNPSEGRGMGTVVCDYDNDGWPDIYITNDTNCNFLYHNNGDGTFVEDSLLTGTGYNGDGIAQGSMGVDCGDYDKDGWLDILTANSETATLYHNSQDGTFTDDTLLVGLSLATYPVVGYSPLFLDYDNDRDLDIFFANGHPQDIAHELSDKATYEQSDQLFRNEGDGTYTDVSLLSGDYFSQKYVGRATAAGDYDNDGDMDIFVVNSDQRGVMLRNEGGEQQHWLRIKLIGIQSNRNGIGARVRIVSQGDVQIAEVKSGSSYASGSDPRLLFGLDDHTQVDELEVRWPSGVRQQVQAVTCDQTVTVTESSAQRQDH